MCTLTTSSVIGILGYIEVFQNSISVLAVLKNRRSEDERGRAIAVNACALFKRSSKCESQEVFICSEK